MTIHEQVDQLSSSHWSKIGAIAREYGVMMACPWCAETIQDAARICRFCQRAVEFSQEVPTVLPKTSAADGPIENAADKPTETVRASVLAAASEVTSLNSLSAPLQKHWGVFAFALTGWLLYAASQILSLLARLGLPLTPGIAGAWAGEILANVGISGLFLIWGKTRRSCWGWGAWAALRLASYGGGN